MYTLNHLETVEEIIAEGQKMHNALELRPYAVEICRRGIKVYSLQDEFRISYASIAVEGDEITHIVGPHNSQIDIKMAMLIRNLAFLQDIELDLTNGIPRKY